MGLEGVDDNDSTLLVIITKVTLFSTPFQCATNSVQCTNLFWLKRKKTKLAKIPFQFLPSLLERNLKLPGNDKMWLFADNNVCNMCVKFYKSPLIQLHCCPAYRPSQSHFKRALVWFRRERTLTVIAKVVQDFISELELMNKAITLRGKFTICAFPQSILLMNER